MPRPEETMATPAKDGTQEEGIFGTQRKDLWWVQPLVIAIGFTAFIVYSTYRGVYGHLPAALQLSVDPSLVPAAAQGIYSGAITEQVAQTRGWSHIPHYLSPFYSPCLAQGCMHGFLAGVIPFTVASITPALYILWAPLGFRATCYYYRKAYYRAYFADPAACAVEEPRHDYKGEAKGLLILQNFHRYFLPFALLLVIFLSYDAIFSFEFTNAATGATEYGISLGSLILTMNVVLLGGYTFGCHALRHLVGGGKDCMTCPKGAVSAMKEGASYRSWKIVSWFNKRHMLWAWLSLFWVAFTDLYVWLITSGTLDPIIWTF